VGSVSDGELRDDDSDSYIFEHDLLSENEFHRVLCENEFHHDANSNEDISEEIFLQDEALPYLETKSDYEAVNPPYSGLNPIIPHRSHEDLADEPTASAEAAMRLMRRSTFNIINTFSRSREVSTGQEPVVEHCADERV
jgi:hypothetical protein